MEEVVEVVEEEGAVGAAEEECNGVGVAAPRSMGDRSGSQLPHVEDG